VQAGWVGGDDGGDGGVSTTVTDGTGTRRGGGTVDLEVDRTKLTFAPLQSREMTVTVRNDGTAPVTLAPPDLEGPDAGQYSAAYTNCPTPLGPGRSCTVTVTFRPTEGGQSSATLVIAPAADDGRAVEVAIEGNHIL
jgi:hypothetical protein